MKQQERRKAQILSTKHRITDALITLIGTEQFEHITVTEICKLAHTSRITFYTYWTDKYELLNEYLKTIKADAENDFISMQKRNNAAGNLTKSWCNMLESILNLQTKYEKFLSRAEPEKDLYLFLCYHWQILANTEQFTKKYCTRIKLKYSVGQMSSFLCNGLWGFIREARSLHVPEKAIRTQAEDVLKSLFRSGLFTGY